MTVAGVSADELRKVTFRELVSTCHSMDRKQLSACDHLLDPQTSVHAIKNTRRKMEDKHVLLPYFGKLFSTSVSAKITCRCYGTSLLFISY